MTIQHISTRHRVLAVLLLLPAGRASHSATAPSNGLPNFHQVTTGLYRGAAPSDAGLLALKKLGVRTIIDLRIAPATVRRERLAANRLGFQTLNIPMGAEAPTARQVARFLSTVTNPRNQPVFVHCQHGADRTGCMIGIFRVTQQRWPFAQTWTEMRRYGFKSFLTAQKQAVRSRAKL